MKEILVVIISILSGIFAYRAIHLIPAHDICANVTKEQDILLPSPHDCSIYYRCENGMAIPQSCPHGLEWCQVLLQCTLPMIANCTINNLIVTYPPDTTPGTTSQPPDNFCPIDGAKLPNPLDCHLYYVCEHEEPVSHSCPEDEEYSCWDQICAPATSAECITSITKPGQNCTKENTKLPNAKDCSTYYECVNGKVELMNCPSGLLYNQWFKECVEPEKAHCNEGSTTTPNPVSTPPPSNSSNICPIDGAKLPNPLDCHLYYVCEHEEPVSHSCPEGEEYSCWDQICAPASSAECITSITKPGQNCTKENTKLPNAKDCSTYYECVNGKVELMNCPSGLLYNQWFKECVEPEKAHCNEGSTTTPNPGTTPSPSNSSNICPIDGAKLPNPLNCHLYYICENEEPVSKSCPNGEDYSCWDQICVPSNTASCINNLNGTESSCSKDGMTLPNTKDCTSYYECKDEKLKLKKCKHGTAFNAWFGKCVPLPLAHCESSTGNNNTQPPPNSCPQDGKTTPDVADCSSYFKCEGGLLVKHTCPNGLVWNCFTQTCSLKSFSPCCKNDPNPPESSSNCLLLGLKIPNPFTCDKYFECFGFKIVEKQCPQGETYDWLKMRCVDALYGDCAPCMGCDNNTITSTSLPTTEPSITVNPNPTCSKEGATMPDSSDCTKYYQCDGNSHLVQKSCPGGLVWNCLDELCSPQTSSLCCPNDLVHGSSNSTYCLKNGKKTPDFSDCSKYYECKEHKIKEKSCEKNKKYDWIKEKCVKADESTCVPGSDGSTSLPTTEPSATVSPTPKCSKEGTTISDSSDCTKYYQCDGNSHLVQKSCPGVLVWNCFNEMCSLQTSSLCCPYDHLHGSDNSTSCSKNGKKTPDFSDCSKYYECKDHKIKEKSCEKNKKYDWIKEKCVKAEESVCAPGSEGPTSTPDDNSSTVTSETTPETTTELTTETTPEITTETTTESTPDTTTETTPETTTETTPETTAETTTETTTPTSPLATESTTTMKPHNPLCPSNGIKYPSTTKGDCTGYFECVDYQLVKKYCANNVYYNCRLEQCDPTNTHCCAANGN